MTLIKVIMLESSIVWRNKTVKMISFLQARVPFSFWSCRNSFAGKSKEVHWDNPSKFITFTSYWLLIRWRIDSIFRAYFSAFWQKLNLLKMSKLNLKIQKLNLKMLKLNGEIEKLLYMANFTPVRSLYVV